jgi:hypothetical protein
MADDRFDRLSSFEGLLFIVRQALEFPAVLDIDVQVFLVYAAVAQLDVGGFGFHTGRLHQDGRLLHLHVQRVAVIRIARESPGANDQGAFERGGNAHLHAEFLGVTALALRYALNF